MGFKQGYNVNGQFDDVFLTLLWKKRLGGGFRGGGIGSRRTNYETVQVIKTRDASGLDWGGGNGPRKESAELTDM